MNSADRTADSTPALEYRPSLFALKTTRPRARPGRCRMEFGDARVQREAHECAANGVRQAQKTSKRANLSPNASAPSTKRES